MIPSIANAIQTPIMAQAISFATYFPIQLITQVFITGIICGAGIPCLYALGLRIYSLSTSGIAAQNSSKSLGLKYISYLLFIICILLVIVGIYFITEPSLEHIFHTKL